MISNVLLCKFRRLVDLTAIDERELLSVTGRRSDVPRQKDIVPRLAKPGYIYVVLSGWAARYGLLADGSRRITGFMVSGDFCGIHAIADAAMDHSIVAITDCQIGAIPLQDVEALISRAPLIGKALWRAKLVDEAILRQWRLSSADAKQAIARMLCELYTRAVGAGLCYNYVCEMPITQNQLGDASGFTEVHTNRILQKLRARGLIEFENRRLRILKPRELRASAQWDDRYLTPWTPQL